VAGLHAVDSERRREDVVVLDCRRGALVGGDAGVLEDHRRLDERLRGLVLEGVLRLADGLAAEVGDNRRNLVDVSLLVVADRLDAARNLASDFVAVDLDLVGVPELFVVELPETVAVEGVLEVLEREGVVQNSTFGWLIDSSSVSPSVGEGSFVEASISVSVPPPSPLPLPAQPARAARPESVGRLGDPNSATTAALRQQRPDFRPLLRPLPPSGRTHLQVDAALSDVGHSVPAHEPRERWPERPHRQRDDSRRGLYGSNSPTAAVTTASNPAHSGDGTVSRRILSGRNRRV